MNHYEALGLKPAATAQEVRSAYQKAARSLHPDRASFPGSEAHFRAATEAYEVLSDQARRAEYDRQNGFAQPKARRPFDPDKVPEPRVDLSDMKWFQSPKDREPSIRPRPSATAANIAHFVIIAAAVVMTVIDPSIVKVLGVLMLLVNYLALHLAIVSASVVICLAAVAWAGIDIYSWATSADTSLVRPATSVPIAVSLVLASLYLSERLSEASKFGLPSDVLLRESVYGEPAAGLSASVGMDPEAVATGVKGEQMTADILEELLRIPGVRIIHGLRFPGSKNADVDHAVVRGRRVALIDSKLWAAGQYSWHDRSTLLKDGTERRPLAFVKAVSYIKSRLGGNARGWVLVHPASSHRGGFRFEGEQKGLAGVRVGDAQAVLQEVGDWLAGDAEYDIEPTVMTTVWELKKAEDTPAHLSWPSEHTVQYHDIMANHHYRSERLQ